MEAARTSSEEPFALFATGSSLEELSSESNPHPNPETPTAYKDVDTDPDGIDDFSLIVFG